MRRPTSQLIRADVFCRLMYDVAGLVVDQVKDKRDKVAVARVIRTAVMSKQYGLEDFLSGLVAEACS